MDECGLTLSLIISLTVRLTRCSRDICLDSSLSILPVLLQSGSVPQRFYSSTLAALGGASKAYRTQHAKVGQQASLRAVSSSKTTLRSRPTSPESRHGYRFLKFSMDNCRLVVALPDSCNRSGLACLPPKSTRSAYLGLTTPARLRVPSEPPCTTPGSDMTVLPAVLYKLTMNEVISTAPTVCGARRHNAKPRADAHDLFHAIAGRLKRGDLPI